MRVLGWSPWTWLSLLVGGLALRLIFVFHQPFTNDEGAYLYDAATLLAGRLPAGGVLAKAPMVAALFAAGVWLTGGSLFAARLVSAFLSTLTAVPLLSLGRRLAGPAVGRLTALLWLFGAGPVLFAAFGQTEAAAVFFGASALALWAHAAAEPRGGRALRWAGAAGLLLALAVASRKTSIAFVVPMALLFGRSPHRRAPRLLVSGGLIGFLLVVVPWLVGVSRLHGSIGLSEALGVGYAEIIAGHLTDPGTVASWVGTPRWALGIGVRLAGPLLLLALSAVVSRTGRASSFVPLSWLAALAVLYAAWPTILPDYLPEFLPGLSVLAAVGAERALSWLSRAGRAFALALFLLWNLVLMSSVYQKPWIGMFTAAAVEEAAAAVRHLVPRNEPILTAALLVPYRSGHRVLFDIAHPFWYRYAFIPPDVHRAFLPPLAEVEEAVRTDARWALVEHFTDYAYLRHPSDLLSFIWREFTFVREIPNETGYRSNPLTLWERSVPAESTGADR